MYLFTPWIFIENVVPILSLLSFAEKSCSLMLDKMSWKYEAMKEEWHSIGYQID